MNADDFGLSESVNQGIRQSFERGIVRSASIMANGPAFEDAVRIAEELPLLGVGIHLTLVGESALTQAFSRGLPGSYPRFVLARLLGTIPEARIKAEIEAQVERVKEAGISPSHLDSHQHIHALPSVARIVWRCARKYKIPVVRTPIISELTGRSPRSIREAQLAVLSGLSRKLQGQLCERKIKSCDRFWGGICAGSLNQENLSLILPQMGSGVNELMCHPGISNEALRSRYGWGYHWDEELAALTSGETLEMVQREGIRLAGFEDAWDASCDGVEAEWKKQ